MRTWRRLLERDPNWRDRLPCSRAGSGAEYRGGKLQRQLGAPAVRIEIPVGVRDFVVGFCFDLEPGIGGQQRQVPTAEIESVPERWGSGEEVIVKIQLTWLQVSNHGKRQLRVLERVLGQFPHAHCEVR
jgi:hypothetical protein